MEGNGDPLISEDISMLKIERSVTPAHLRLMRPVGEIRAEHKKIKKITCLGSGFVGGELAVTITDSSRNNQGFNGHDLIVIYLKGPTSAVTAYKANVEVTVVDINETRIQAWQSDNLPIYEPGLFDVVKAARDGISANLKDLTSDLSTYDHMLESNGVPHQKRLFFSTDIETAIEEADLIFVCVNTPTKATGVGKGAAADIGFVETATRTIARVAMSNKIVVEKSTVPCKTAESIRAILSENAHPGVRFDVLSNPEFLAEGTAIRDLLVPDRIIIGSMPDPEGYAAAASLVDVYRQWVPIERIITMNLWSSELCKLAANAMLAQRISSVNALSAICEVTGADVDEVSYACGLDSRIGPQMLKAGPGFGGSCFQKDIFNIVYLSESLNLKEVADYWRAITNMNEHQKDRFTKRIISCLFNNLTNKRIAVLGFAFKKDTSDTRESPAITLVSNFVGEQAKVAIYDPKVKEDQIWKELVDYGGKLAVLKLHVEVCSNPYTACQGADAVVLVTEWDEFGNKTREFEDTVLRDVSPNRMRVFAPAKNSMRRRETGQPTSPKFQHKEITMGGTQSVTLSDMDTMIASEFITRLDWGRIAKSMRKPKYVFDGRNMLDHGKLEALGFRVEAIGKASRSRDKTR